MSFGKLKLMQLEKGNQIQLFKYNDLWMQNDALIYHLYDMHSL